MASTAARLRELRKGLGLSQADFAKRIGASQGSISKWENGSEEPRLSVLLKVQEEFGADALQLLWPEEHKLSTSYGGENPIKIVGAVEYGVFREKPLWDEDDWLSIDLPLHKGFDLDLQGFIVKDDSADELFAPGSIVFVNNGPSPSTDLMAVFDEDVLLVSHSKGDLTENVLVKNRNAGGKLAGLDPITRNPDKRRLLDINEWNFHVRGIVMINLQHLPAYDRIKEGSHVWVEMLKNSK